MTPDLPKEKKTDPVATELESQPSADILEAALNRQRGTKASFLTATEQSTANVKKSLLGSQGGV